MFDCLFLLYERRCRWFSPVSLEGSLFYLNNSTYIYFPQRLSIRGNADFKVLMKLDLADLKKCEGVYKEMKQCGSRVFFPFFFFVCVCVCFFLLLLLFSFVVFFVFIFLFCISVSCFSLCNLPRLCDVSCLFSHHRPTPKHVLAAQIPTLNGLRAVFKCRPDPVLGDEPSRRVRAAAKVLTR